MWPVIARLAAGITSRVAASGVGRAAASRRAATRVSREEFGNLGDALKDVLGRRQEGSKADIGGLLRDLMGTKMGSAGDGPGGPGGNRTVGDFAFDKAIDYAIYRTASRASKPPRAGTGGPGVTSRMMSPGAASVKNAMADQGKRAIGNIGTILNPFELNPFEKLKAMVDLPRQALEFPFRVAEWGEALVEGQRHLSAFNAEIARSMLESDRRNIIRNVESGRRTSWSTERVTEATSDLKDTLQPIKDFGTNVVNNIAAGGIVTIDYLMGLLALAFPKWISDWFAGDKHDIGLFEQFIQLSTRRDVGPRDDNPFDPGAIIRRPGEPPPEMQ